MTFLWIYALIEKKNEIENLSTKKLSHEIEKKQNYSVKITEKYRQHQWPMIWSTLAQLRKEPSPSNLVFYC